MTALVSEAGPSVPDMSYNPWRRFRGLAHFELRWHDGGPMGVTIHSEQAVSLRRGMSWESRRVTIDHECDHIEDGPMPFGLRAKREERIRRDTALRMIPEIEPVADAIAWALSEEEAARELGVDVYVLRYRLKHMSPLDRAYLNARLQQDDAIGEY